MSFSDFNSCRLVSRYIYLLADPNAVASAGARAWYVMSDQGSNLASAARVSNHIC